ncbi:VOC family protein [Phenylobacterium aquaticum]|uniref:VOC family protein n=1 Tax=Phenylobacterium aquaticum TaxID=1763816 RepID=UPI001F5CC5E5|nr:VOC family protein [Phenylobacterium aquaticum]MCI3135229.1 VOC family protein [Phenylobacterium aquaticum]
MLAHARLQTLVWTADTARAGAFYSDVLGLPLKGQSFGALVYEVGGGELRVSPVPSTEPSAHTVVGFAVDDLEPVVAGLERAGVVPERFPNFAHDPRGVWTAPDGTKIIWFRDPDGNLLSVVRYG